MGSDDRQFDRLRQLLLFAYERSAFYRALYDKHNVDLTTIRSLSDFSRRIPIITKQDVLRAQSNGPPFGELLCVPPDEVAQVNITGGTSGQGKEVYGLTRADARLTGLWYARGVLALGVPPGSRIAFTFPLSLSGAPQWISQGLTDAGFCVLPMGSYDTSTKLELMKEFGATVLLATPSYAEALAQAGLEKGWDVRRDLAIDHVLVATESFSIQRAKRIEDLWEAKLFEWYGSSQRAVSWTCRNGALRDDSTRGILHHWPAVELLETLDHETREPVTPGESGEIVVTNLLVRGTPVIRFASGDRATLVGAGDCDCDYGTAGYEAGGIERYDDMLKVRGVSVWPSRIDDIVFANSSVVDYRGLVDMGEHREERCTLTVEFRPGESATTQSSVLDDIAKRIRTDVGIRASTVVAQAPLAKADDPRAKARRWEDRRDVATT